MFQLSSPPDITYFKAHYHCDYIELLALASNTDEVAAADVMDHYYDSDGEAFAQGTSEHSEISDEWEKRLLDWFTILESRQMAYGENYPFEVKSRNFISLKQNLSPQHKIYLFFLLCSNLGKIPKQSQNNCTTDFEVLSDKAFSQYLPQSSQCHRFGKSANKNERYCGNIRDKVQKFAQDIGCKTDFEDDFFAENDSGDYGLDIVAWSPIGRDMHLKNIQIYLGQCATGKNWLGKQNEPDRIMNAIHGVRKPVVVLFVPYDCRNSDRSFNEKAQITTHLMFDRFRLVALLATHADTLSNLTSHQLVQDAIAFQEDIV